MISREFHGGKIMGIFVNTNVRALNTQRSLNMSNKGLDRTFQRLSSGKRINAAKDDAAGLSISTRFTAQIRGLNMAVRNTNDGISLTQTVEGALQESTNILQRMRELSVQAANDVNTRSDRSAINAEVQDLISELDRIAETTTFNDQKVLNGDYMQGYFHIGHKADDTIQVNIRDTRAKSLGRSAIMTTATVTTNALSRTAGDFTIEGANGAVTVRSTSAADDALSTSYRAGSAIAKAAAINDMTPYTEVEARVLETEHVAANPIAGGTLDSTSYIQINGEILTTFDVQPDDGDHMLKDQINSVADRTGVIASYDINGRLVLKASDGRNIEIVVSDAIAEAATGLSTMVATARIELSSPEQYEIGGANAGFVGTAAQIVGVDSLQSIDSVDTETRESSNHAITIIDRALEQVSKERSALGSLQNRLESTVNNLTNVVENASASRSRILDADFAAESASLARGQVLQQAGISILAQANQGPNMALSLLG